MASLRRSPDSSASRDDGRRILAEWAEFFMRVDNGNLYGRILRYLITDKISDSCMATAVPATLMFESGSGAKVMRFLRRKAKEVQPIRRRARRPLAGIEI